MTNYTRGRSKEYRTCNALRKQGFERILRSKRRLEFICSVGLSAKGFLSDWRLLPEPNKGQKAFQLKSKNPERGQSSNIHFLRTLQKREALEPIPIPLFFTDCMKARGHHFARTFAMAFYLESIVFQKIQKTH